jgi:hypothetical protein
MLQYCEIDFAAHLFTSWQVRPEQQPPRPLQHFNLLIEA